MDNNFFEKIEDHTAIKLTILEIFFPIWVNKIFFNPFNKDNGELVLFDGFSGPGIYKNGEVGSPIICLNHSIKILDKYHVLKDTNGKKLKIILYFSEKDGISYKKLCDNILFHCDIIIKQEKFYKEYCNSNKDLKVKVYNENFNKNFISFSQEIGPKPCFLFIDPFGYKDIEFGKISDFISNKKADVILNMMYEELNRFITKEDSSLNISQRNFLGATTKEFKELQSELKLSDSKNRVLKIVSFYKNKWKEKELYVSEFIIRKGKKVKMILFYITKNYTGFDAFKEIKHKIVEDIEKRKRNFNLLLINPYEDREKDIENFLLKKLKFEDIVYDDLEIEIKKHDLYFLSEVKKVIKKLIEKKEIFALSGDKRNNKKFKGTIIKKEQMMKLF